MTNVVDFKEARLKKNSNLYKVVSIDDSGNVTIQNFLGEKIIFDEQDWITVCFENNRSGLLNPFWPSLESEDIEAEWNVLTKEQHQKINEWDMQRIIEYVQPDSDDLTLRELFSIDVAVCCDCFMVA